MREVQRNYRAAPPRLTVHPAAPGAANPGTIGTAADWLLRFLMHPQPDLHLPLAGVLRDLAGHDIGLTQARYSFHQLLAQL